MADGVNFLREKIKVIQKKARFAAVVRIGSFVVAIVYLGIVLGVFGLYLMETNKKKNLETKVEEAKKNIEGLSSIETKEAYLVSTVKTISPIISTKKKNNVLIQSVLKLLPENVNVSEFDISESNEIEFILRTNDLDLVEDFFENIKKATFTDLIIKQVEINRVAIEEESGYSVTVTLIFEYGEESEED